MKFAGSASASTVNMTKPRGVQFKHRGSPTEGRRPSDLSEAMEAPNGDLSKSEVIVEEKEPTTPEEPSEYSKKKSSFITRYEVKQLHYMHDADAFSARYGLWSCWRASSWPCCPAIFTF